MGSATTTVEALLRRERSIIALGLILITAIAWLWVLSGAGTGMGATAMTTPSFPPPIMTSMAQDWSIAHAALMVSMWWIMMIAMMTPSATPLILLYARAYRHAQGQDKLATAATPTLAFASGYLSAWLAFSIGATGLQWALERAGLVHAMFMWSVSPILSALLLIAAGAYQFSPLKNICLKHCRSPVQFLAEHFRPGTLGAFTMGWKHGGYCLGCCWFLMSLLFAGGVMNLLWIAGLAIFVLVEKLFSIGYQVARVAGVFMICAGLWLLVR